MKARRVPLAEPDLSGNEQKYVLECIRTGWISGKGKFIEQFEERFASYIGVKHAIAVSSGTAALHLSVDALGIAANDTVLMPAFTMISCANVVRYLGAKPLLVDSERFTWNMDPEVVESKITERTKAVMLVHIYGHPANVESITSIAKKHNLFVIEDAAEAHGAEYNGKKVGSIGDIGCFSFYANKIMTTGEGGMVTCNDDSLADKVRRLRDQGYDKKQRKWLIHDMIGYNYRLTNVQAAIGLAQLERIDQFIQKHRENARYYDSLLKGMPGLTTPPHASWAKSVYWMYTILVDKSIFGVSRDRLIELLEESGIDARATFRPIHLQPPYSESYKSEHYPIAEELGERGINLPSGNTLEKESIDYVADNVRQIVRKRAKP